MRLILLNFFSFVKRLAFAFPATYKVIAAIPFLFSIGVKISKKGLVISSIILFFIFLNSAFDRITLYIPIILILIFSPTFKQFNTLNTIKKLLPFLIVALLYGLYQKLYGYTTFEYGWINSGLSIVGADNYFITDDLRPFSFFAGVGEFAVFISMFSYYFLIKKQYLKLLISLILIFLVGSRGVFLATVITIWSIFRLNNTNYQRAVLKIIVYSMLLYLFLAIIYPLYIHEYISSLLSDGSRIAVYGTFRARVISALTLLENFGVKHFFIGINRETEILAQNLNIDNLYLRLLNDFGLVISIIFIVLLIRNVRSKNQVFALGILFGYGFYNDVIPSYYLLFNLAFIYYSHLVFGKKNDVSQKQNLPIKTALPGHE